jgi:DNA-binding NtrC family response regulator
MLRKVFSRNGMTVDTANNAADALKMVKENNYDLALIDICMQPVDGLELLKEMRKASPRLQAVMMTGYPSKFTARKSQELGAADYLTKPIGIDELNKVITKTIG